MKLQPIATAQRDGRPLLVWNGYSAQNGFTVAYYGSGAWRIQNGFDAFGSDGIEEPLMWAPLDEYQAEARVIFNQKRSDKS